MRMALRMTKRAQKKLEELGSTTRLESSTENEHGLKVKTNDILNDLGYVQPPSNETPGGKKVTIQPGVKGETKEEAELRRLRQTRESEEREDRQLKEQLKQANGERKLKELKAVKEEAEHNQRREAYTRWVQEQISNENELAEQRAAERRRIIAREDAKGSKGNRSDSGSSDDKNEDWPPRREHGSTRKEARKKKEEALKIKVPDYNTGRTWREMAKPLEVLYSRLEECEVSVYGEEDRGEETQKGIELIHSEIKTIEERVKELYKEIGTRCEEQIRTGGRLER